MPKLKVVGFDISKYGIKNSHPEIKKYLFNHDVRKKTKFKKKEFDLVIIATAANVRQKVVAQLLEGFKVDYLVLEKILLKMWKMIW